MVASRQEEKGRDVRGHTHCSGLVSLVRQPAKRASAADAQHRPLATLQDGRGRRLGGSIMRGRHIAACANSREKSQRHEGRYNGTHRVQPHQQDVPAPACSCPSLGLFYTMCEELILDGLDEKWRMSTCLQWWGILKICSSCGGWPSARGRSRLHQRPCLPPLDRPRPRAGPGQARKCMQSRALS